MNSKQGTRFRIWATQCLKEHLVQGYTLNQNRLDQLQQTIQLIQQSGATDELNLQEAKVLLDIISNYTQSFVLPNRYDSNKLETGQLNENITYENSAWGSPKQPIGQGTNDKTSHPQLSSRPVKHMDLG